jgi:hypothetical protein
MSARRRRSGAVRLRLSKATLARLVPAALFALATGWLLVVVSGANIVREVRPDLALGMMPFDARAKAKSAERLSASPRATPAQLREAQRLATEALDRDPTIASAWRTLGLVSTLGNRPGAAAGFFHTSERISRRDVPTQLWLIEEAVARNNIPAVLHHYDVALRTSRSSHPLLLPILIAATASDGVVPNLVPLLRTGPPWQEAFYQALLDQPPPGTNFLQLLRRLRGTPGAPTPAIMGRLVSRLVDTQRFAQAYDLYRQMRGRPAGELLRNGGFDHENVVPPFDWLFEDGDASAAQGVVRGSGQGPTLQVSAVSGASGNVATQILVLRPGAYTLAARSGTTEGARPANLLWTVGCARGGPAVLGTVQAPADRGAGVVETLAFQVPGGCDAQRVTLSVQADFDPQGVGGWVDDVAIRPRR